MRILSLIWLTLAGAAAHAADFTCQVEHIRDLATVKANAKICGEFRFTTDGPAYKKEAMKDCHGAVAIFSRNQAEFGGVNYLVEISQAGKSAAQLLTAALPAKFTLISSRPFLEKKHTLSEDFFIHCKQAQ